jgi:hypothetical protein
MATTIRARTANEMHALVALVLGPHRSRREVNEALEIQDVYNLALVSTGVYVAMIFEKRMRMRNVLQVPSKSQFRAYRPVVAFAGVWPGRDGIMVSVFSTPCCDLVK